MTGQPDTVRGQMARLECHRHIMLHYKTILIYSLFAIDEMSSESKIFAPQFTMEKPGLWKIRQLPDSLF